MVDRILCCRIIGTKIVDVSEHIRGKFKIPYGITSISHACFCGCYGLTEVEIPPTVESIGDYAFHRCFRLRCIKGIKGSYAEQYAKEHNIKFVAI